MILVDDCSSDNTAEVVKELQTRFPTLRYFRNEVNSKQPYTQNVAISKVQSEYIYFGDDDSVLYPGSIRNLLNVMREKNADIVGGRALALFFPEQIDELDEFCHIIAIESLLRLIRLLIYPLCPQTLHIQ